MDSWAYIDLCERWEKDYLANKNMLAFGEYDFDYDDYADLVKQSYYCLKEIFDSYESSVVDLYNVSPNFLTYYAELVSLIRSYGTTEFFMDFSKEYVASMLIAKKLADNCYMAPLTVCGVHGMLSVLSFCWDDDEENNIKYDIETGDFSDIIDNAYNLIDYLWY